MTRETFKGWPRSALAFFEGLEADNSKTYWLSHQQVYEQAVRAPMVELLSELTAEFGEVHLFRPYGDTRFSADKSPYKTAIAATIGQGYIQLSAHGLQAGVGVHQMTNDQLERYRTAVVADRTGQQLYNIISDLRQAGLEVHGSEELKTAPKGYPKDHTRIELLRYKRIVAGKVWPTASWLSTAAAKERIVDLFRTAAPLVDWLTQNVGPTQGPEAVPSRR
jgi:uncharacterized protein (TIGR02453 family)